MQRSLILLIVTALHVILADLGLVNLMNCSFEQMSFIIFWEGYVKDVNFDHKFCVFTACVHNFIAHYGVCMLWNVTGAAYNTQLKISRGRFENIN
jgi:hypothetical protein